MSKWNHFQAAAVCIVLWLVSWPYDGPKQLQDCWWRGPLCFIPIYGHAVSALVVALALTALLYTGIALRNWLGVVFIFVFLMLWYLPILYLMIHDQA